MRGPTTASRAGSSVSDASTETSGISMPPMPIERTSGSGSAISASRPMATVEPETITERPAWVTVSTSAVSTSLRRAHLLAEAQDHQQRVVDRDAEPDQRDQELDDDRDVGDVGQRPHEREGVEDRRDGDGERHEHRGQRPEDEQQDDQRADPADHGLDEHARPAARAVLARLVERVAARDVDADPGRQAGRAAARIRSALLPRSRRAAPGGYTTGNVVCRSRERYIGFPVEKYELMRAPGTAAAARRMAALDRAGPRRIAAVWKTTTSGARAPAPNAASARWPAS